MRKMKVGGLLGLSAGACVAGVMLACRHQDKQDAQAAINEYRLASVADLNRRKLEVRDYLFREFQSRDYTPKGIEVSIGMVIKQIRKELHEQEALSGSMR